MTASEMNAESLSRATSGQATSNYGTIFLGFIAKGIDESEILPRINVLTFRAWRAKGRTVRKGEHGVRVVTWIPIDGKTNKTTGEVEPGGKRCKSATVFHVSQTAELTGKAAT